MASNRWLGCASALSLACLVASAHAAITEDRVLILVNDASPTSHNTAVKYRQYHPGIPQQNVVYLTGIPDITTSADEIITRSDFETYIAEPVRQHLLNNGLVDHIWVIVTTAGMPYRIEDTNFANVVYPHGGSVSVVEAQAGANINAASVESELAVLWQIDPALDPNHRAPLEARIVNPYHGYVSPMSEFCADRDILARRTTLNFATPPTDSARVYEGQEFNFYRATAGRQFCVKDMYLVSRLDGPRSAEYTPDYYIGRMLEMAARVSNPSHPAYHGYDPMWSAVVIDDKASGEVSDSNLWHSPGSAIGHSTPPEQYLTASIYPTPPCVAGNGLYRDDLRYAYRSLTGGADLPDPNDGMVVAMMASGLIGGPVVYDPCDTLITAELDPNFGVGALCSFGVHQEGGAVPPTYLLDGGPGGSALLYPVYGAIFNTAESFNAVTFFADADIPPQAQQALVWQWIFIGGSGGLGHAFEPLSTSVADNDLLLYNYFRDSDLNGVGDMTFVEAAYAAMPYLSWATVVVGDPLMCLNQNVGVGPGWMSSGCGTGSGGGLMAAFVVLACIGYSARARKI